jgi:thymidylate synthase
MNHYNSIQDVYIESLKNIRKTGRIVSSVTDKSSVGSLFGKKERDFKELLGYSFVLTNPRNRLIYSRARKLSFGFSIANLIWLLSGRNDVETISFYNKHGNVYSNNGVYYEAAFGDRIFGNLKLWESAKELLIKDENTRRALMPIFIPNDLKMLPNDTPCASSIQIMIRDKRIDFLLHMRSQSVAMVLPYDMFLFTMLHEFISKTFKLPMGNFYYYCNSFHYYLEEETIVSDILKEDLHLPKEMEEMCFIDNKVLSDIIQTETEIRKYAAKGKQISAQILSNLPVYWQNLCHVLNHKACIDHGIEPQPFNSIYTSDPNIFI